MHCPSCNHDNRADRRFCAECGAVLSVACPSCGAPTEAGEKFCGGCGGRLPTAAPAPGAPTPTPEPEASAYFVKGDLATAAEVAKEALAAAERTGDAFDLLSSHYQVGIPLLFQGHFSQALRHFEHGIKLYNPGAHGSLAYAVDIDRSVDTHAFAGRWERCSVEPSPPRLCPVQEFVSHQEALHP